MGKRLVSGPRARCNVDGRLYLAHRIIWFLHHGKDPGDRLIDHIDGNPSNNKISNLRLSDKVANGMNRLGLRGVQRVKNYNSWRVSFRGKHYGYHHDFFEACCERKSLEAEFWQNESA